MLEPFLKWPGGKRWLVHRHSTIFPANYGCYLEPFLGGGAVFFWLKPLRSILSDTNADLVNAYAALKKDVATIHKTLQRLHRHHSEELYYRIRKQRPTDVISRAVRFLYLNRTCFNGIYRVNLKGDFNVPIGSKNLVKYSFSYLSEVSACLRHSVLRVCDFEETINAAKANDFIFVDPPYTVMHNNNNFVKYNARLFSWSDQVRLAEAIKRADRRGAQIMLSNADHQSIRDLYVGFGKHYAIPRSSILSADSAHRRGTTELLIVNYHLPESVPGISQRTDGTCPSYTEP